MLFSHSRQPAEHQMFAKASMALRPSKAWEKIHTQKNSLSWKYLEMSESSNMKTQTCPWKTAPKNAFFFKNSLTFPNRFTRTDLAEFTWIYQVAVSNHWKPRFNHSTAAQQRTLWCQRPGWLSLVCSKTKAFFRTGRESLNAFVDLFFKLLQYFSIELVTNISNYINIEHVLTSVLYTSQILLCI